MLPVRSRSIVVVTRIIIPTTCSLIIIAPPRGDYRNYHVEAPGVLVKTFLSLQLTRVSLPLWKSTLVVVAVCANGLWARHLGGYPLVKTFSSQTRVSVPLKDHARSGCIATDPNGANEVAVWGGYHHEAQ